MGLAEDYSLVSKLAEMEARVLLPLGEGGPKGRMRVHFLPSPGASRHPLQRERDIPETGFQIENSMKPASILLLERTASCNLDESVVNCRAVEVTNDHEDFSFWFSGRCLVAVRCWVAGGG